MGKIVSKIESLKYRDRIRLSQSEIEENDLEVQEELSINNIDKFINFLEGKFISIKDELNTVNSKLKTQQRDLEKLKSAKPLNMQNILTSWELEKNLQLEKEEIESRHEKYASYKERALALKAELF